MSTYVYEHHTLYSVWLVIVSGTCLQWSLCIKSVASLKQPACLAPNTVQTLYGRPHWDPAVTPAWRDILINSEVDWYTAPCGWTADSVLISEQSFV